MEDFYAKYKLLLLPMIHHALSNKHGTTEWDKLYTPEENRLRMELLKVMKSDLIKKKRDELGGKSADELLTKENLESWLNKGETYNSIAYNYTGTPPEKISRIAREYGLKSKGKEAYTNAALPIDESLTVYVNEHSIESILHEIASVLKYEKKERTEVQPATKPVNYETLDELLKEHKTYKSVAEILKVSEDTVSELCEVYGLDVKGDVKKRSRYVYMK
jgi:hypothetical protein